MSKNKVISFLNVFLRIVERKKYLFLLLFAITIGFFLRVYRLLDYMEFTGDNGRDLLVAKHIIEYDEYISTGPASSTAFLNNSPLYYYLLSLFWYLTPSAETITLIFAVFGTLNIGLMYFLGREVSNEKVGIISAIFIAFSEIMVNYSRSIWQPHLIPFFSILSILNLVLAIKRKNLYLLIISETTLAIALHLHYSTLLLVPVMVMCFFYVFIKLYKSSVLTIQNIVLFFSISIILVTTWAVLTTQTTPLSQLITVFNIPGTSTLNFFSTFQTTYTNWLQLLNRSLSIPSNTTLTLVNCLLILTTFYSIKISWKEKKDIFYFFLIISLLISITFSIFFRKQLYDHYFSPLFPIIYLWLALLINTLFKQRNNVQLFVTILIVGILLIPNKIFFQEWSRQDLAHTKIISSKILSIEKNYPNESNFTLYVKRYLAIDNWDAPPFWFFLEEISQKKLIKIVNTGSNIAPIHNSTDRTYVICDFYPSEVEVIQNCLKPALKKITMPHNKKINTFSLVRDGGHKTVIFMINHLKS